MGRGGAAGVENAPPGRRAWYGCPAARAPVGFVCSACIFLLLSAQLTDAQFFSSAGVPFPRVRARHHRAVRAARNPRDAVPRGADAPRAREAADAGRRPDYPKELVVGTMIALATFVLLSDDCFRAVVGHTALGYTRQQSSDPAVRPPLFALTIPCRPSWRTPWTRGRCYGRRPRSACSASSWRRLTSAPRARWRRWRSASG